jgi:hypothetical protein
MLCCHPSRPARINWPTHHSTQDDVITTTLRHENHEVSEVGVCRCADMTREGVTKKGTISPSLTSADA